MSLDRIEELGKNIHDAHEALKGSLGQKDVIVVKSHGHYEVRKVEGIWDHFLQLLSRLGIYDGKKDALKALYFSAKELHATYDAAVEQMKTDHIYAFSETFLRLQNQQALVKEAADVLKAVYSEDEPFFNELYQDNYRIAPDGQELIGALEGYGTQVNKRVDEANQQLGQRLGQLSNAAGRGLIDYGRDKTVPNVQAVIRSQLEWLASRASWETHQDTLGKLDDDSKPVAALKGVMKDFEGHLKELVAQRPDQVAEGYLYIHKTLTEELARFNQFVTANPAVREYLDGVGYDELSDIQQSFEALQATLLNSVVQLKDQTLDPLKEAVARAEAVKGEVEKELEAASLLQNSEGRGAHNQKRDATAHLAQDLHGIKELTGVLAEDSREKKLLQLVTLLVSGNQAQQGVSLDVQRELLQQRQGQISALADDLGIAGPLNSGAFLGNASLKAALQELQGGGLAKDLQKRAAEKNADLVKLQKAEQALQEQLQADPAVAAAYGQYRGDLEAFDRYLEGITEEVFPLSLYWTDSWVAADITVANMSEEARAKDKLDHPKLPEVLRWAAARPGMVKVAELQRTVNALQGPAQKKTLELETNQRLKEAFKAGVGGLLNAFASVEAAKEVGAQAEEALKQKQAELQVATEFHQRATAKLASTIQNMAAANEAYETLKDGPVLFDFTHDL